MNMNTQEVDLLSANELDAVIGGMMNNHQGDPLQTPKNTGGHSGAGLVNFVGDVLLGSVIIGALLGL
jgi:hypothetical protein